MERLVVTRVSRVECLLSRGRRVIRFVMIGRLVRMGVRRWWSWIRVFRGGVGGKISGSGGVMGIGGLRGICIYYDGSKEIMIKVDERCGSFEVCIV